MISCPLVCDEAADMAEVQFRAKLLTHQPGSKRIKRTAGPYSFPRGHTPRDLVTSWDLSS